MRSSSSKPAEVQSKAVTVKLASEILSCSQRSVWRLLAGKKLNEVRIGRAVRITRESIDQFIAQGGER